MHGQPIEIGFETNCVKIKKAWKFYYENAKPDTAEIIPKNKN